MAAPVTAAMAKNPIAKRPAHNSKVWKKPAKTTVAAPVTAAQATADADVQEGGVFVKSWRATVGAVTDGNPIIWRLQGIKFESGKVIETWHWAPDTIGATPLIAALPMPGTQQ